MDGRVIPSVAHRWQSGPTDEKLLSQPSCLPIFYANSVRSGKKVLPRFAVVSSAMGSKSVELSPTSDQPCEKSERADILCRLEWTAGTRVNAPPRHGSDISRESAECES